MFLLKKPGKGSQKAEVFRANGWAAVAEAATEGLGARYRVRANGKWLCRKNERYSFFTSYEIRDMLWRSIKGSF